MLTARGTKAKRSPISSTTRKKKLELDALIGLAADLHVCIKTVWRGKVSKTYQHICINTHPNSLPPATDFPFSNMPPGTTQPPPLMCMGWEGLRQDCLIFWYKSMSPNLGKNFIQRTSHTCTETSGVWSMALLLALSSHIFTGYIPSCKI